MCYIHSETVKTRCDRSKLLKWQTSWKSQQIKVDNCCEIHGDYDKDMQVNPSKLWKFEAFVETLNSESGNTESWNTASRC